MSLTPAVRARFITIVILVLVLLLVFVGTAYSLAHGIAVDYYPFRAQSGTILPNVYLFLPVNHAAAMRDHHFCRVVQSAIVNGWEPRILNWDADHVDMKMAKVNGMADLLSSRLHTASFSNHDLIFMIDAFDVWLQLPPKVMAKRFLEYGKLLLAAAEKNCAPNPRDTHACVDAPPSPLPIDLYWKTEQPHPLDASEHAPLHANSGTVIGRLHQMRAFYTELQRYIQSADFQGTNDQYPFNELLADGRLDLDYYSRLFWDAFDDWDGVAFIGTSEPTDHTSDIDLIPWHLYPPLGHHSRLGHVPVSLHYNGGYKSDMDKWWSKMWWASSNRFKPIVRERMEKGKIAFVTDDGYDWRNVSEVCPGLDIWAWEG